MCCNDGRVNSATPLLECQHVNGLEKTERGRSVTGNGGYSHPSRTTSLVLRTTSHFYCRRPLILGEDLYPAYRMQLNKTSHSIISCRRCSLWQYSSCSIGLCIYRFFRWYGESFGIPRFGAGSTGIPFMSRAFTLANAGAFA